MADLKVVNNSNHPTNFPHDIPPSVIPQGIGLQKGIKYRILAPGLLFFGRECHMLT
jgi:hypothetical protein